MVTLIQLKSTSRQLDGRRWGARSIPFLCLKHISVFSLLTFTLTWDPVNGGKAPVLGQEQCGGRAKAEFSLSLLKSGTYELFWSESRFLGLISTWSSMFIHGWKSLFTISGDSLCSITIWSVGVPMVFNLYAFMSSQCRESSKILT